MYSRGHIADHDAVVARRAGLHLHPEIGAMRASTLPLETFNRMTLPISKGGPGIKDQDGIGMCFPAGTPILMADGTERPIEEIGQGNEVRTHNGLRRRVTSTMRRRYSGAMYSIALHGCVYSTMMTEEHPVCVVRPANKSRTYEPGEIEWVAAKDVRPGDYVLLPSEASKDNDVPVILLNTADFIQADVFESNGRTRCSSARVGSIIPSTIKADAKFARLIGLFLAEGSYQKTHGSVNGIDFSFGRHEKNYHAIVIDSLKDIFGVEARVEERDAAVTSTVISVSNETLAKFLLGLCGQGALRKEVPEFLYRSPRAVRLAAIRGWLEGDGTQAIVTESRRSIQICGCTSSIALHRGFFRLSLSCGLKPGCQRKVQDEHQNAPACSLYFYGNDALAIFPERREEAAALGAEPSGMRKNHREHPFGFVVRVKSVTVSDLEDPIDVFNLEVEGEHTYVANLIAVHNCEGEAHSSGANLVLALAGTPTGIFAGLGLYYGALLIDRVPNADGTLPALKDTGTMPSSILSAWQLWGVTSELKWGQLPATTSTVYVDPSNPNSDLIAPTQEQLFSEQGCKFKGAYFVISSGRQRIIDVMTVLASKKVLSDAIPASQQDFQGYTGGIIGPTAGPVDHANLIVDFKWGGTQADLDNWLAGGDDSLMTKYLTLYGVNSWGEGWGESDVPELSGGLYRANRAFLDQSAVDLCVLDIARA